MACEEPKIKLCVHQYSDVMKTVSCTDASNNAFSLEGYDVNVVDESTYIVGRVSAVVTNAAAGEFEFTVEGTDPIRLGVHRFRLQLVDPDGLTEGGFSTGLPQVEIEVV